MRETQNTATPLRRNLITPRYRRAKQLMTWQKEVSDCMGKLLDLMPPAPTDDDIRRQSLVYRAYNAATEIYQKEIFALDAEIALLEKADEVTQ